MSWFHIDNDAAFHRKTRAAGNEAFGALCRMGSHSAKYGLDGFIDTETAKDIAGKDAVIKKLVDVVFLHQVEGGYRIHDYHQYNPSAADIAARKAIRAANGKKGGHASGQARQQAKGQAIGEAIASAHALANDAAHAGSLAEATAQANQEAKSKQRLEQLVKQSGSSRVPASDAPASDPESGILNSSPYSPTPLPSSFQTERSKTEANGEASASFSLGPNDSKPAKRRRAKPANIPPSNEPPAPGTPARRVFDAIVGDPYVSQITDAPADFATRITTPDAYPGVNVVATVLKALEWRAGKGAEYRDGRAFLRGWLEREAKELARKPAATRGPAPPAPPEAFPTTARDIDPWAPKASKAS